MELEQLIDQNLDKFAKNLQSQFKFPEQIALDYHNEELLFDNLELSSLEVSNDTVSVFGSVKANFRDIGDFNDTAGHTSDLLYQLNKGNENYTDQQVSKDQNYLIENYGQTAQYTNYFESTMKFKILYQVEDASESLNFGIQNFEILETKVSKHDAKPNQSMIDAINAIKPDNVSSSDVEKVLDNYFKDEELFNTLQEFGYEDDILDEIRPEEVIIELK